VHRSAWWPACLVALALTGCGAGQAETAAEARERAEAYLAGTCDRLGATACAGEGYQGMWRQPGIWAVDYCVDGLDIVVIVPDGQPVELSTMPRDAPCPAPRID